MKREEALKVWEDLTRELWPDCTPVDVANCVEIRPIAWLREPFLEGGFSGRMTSPGWVDRRVFPQIPAACFDFTRIYGVK